MTDYKQKALEIDYETYIEFLVVCVQEKIDKDNIGLKAAAEDIVSEAFEQLRDDKPAMDKLFADANEVLDPPCKDDTELEQQVLDTVIQEIHDDEMYMAKKTDSLLDPRRLKF